MPAENGHLFRSIKDWVSSNYPGRIARRLWVELDDGERVRLPMPAMVPEPAPLFVPSDLQNDILEALDGKALNAEQLAEAVGVSRRSLYRHPGGLRELQEQGAIARHAHLGYLRPDSPPQTLPE
jgi:biotin operon repressor